MMGDSVRKSSELIRQLETAGARVSKSNGGHLRVECPNGALLFTSSTPSEYRAYKNFTAKARREGGLRI